MTRASNVVAPARGRDAPGRVRPLPRPKREDVEHQVGEVVGPLRLDVLARRSSTEWVEKLGRLSDEADEVYALFNNNRDDFAPRSAVDPARPSRRGRHPGHRRHRAAAADADALLTTVAPVRVLSVTHGPSVPGGVFDEAVEAAGHILERWSVPDGANARPGRELRRGHGLRRLDAPRPGRPLRLARERGGVPARTSSPREVPVFGVCLGAQMLARAAGATVEAGERTRDRMARRLAHPRRARTTPCSATLPPTATVFQWHHYTFEIPPGGIELARSEICTQAFRLADQPAWGIQFHAEVTLPMVDRVGRRRTRTSSRCPPAELRAESEGRIEQSNAQGRALADAFLREAASR